MVAPTRRQFLFNVLPAGALFCLGCGNSRPLETTDGQMAAKDESLADLWSEMVLKGYT